MRKAVCHSLIFALVVTIAAMGVSRAVVATNSLTGLVASHQTVRSGTLHQSHDHHQHGDDVLWNCLQECVDGSPDTYVMTAATLAETRPDIKTDYKLLPASALDVQIRALKKSTLARGPPVPPLRLSTSGSRGILLLTARLRI